MSFGVGSALFTGRLGLGTARPLYSLHLAKDSAAKPSTSTWTVNSDERLKEDVVPADLARCYQIVRSLPMKRFAWRKDVYTDDQVDDRRKLGWLAQDVERIFPRSVQRGAAHDIADCRSLNIDQLLAALYGCVQDMQGRLERLEGLDASV
jgi:hypothetical protein